MTDRLVLHGISSMATKTILSILTSLYRLKTGIIVEIESIGGVDAKKRIQNNECFDIVLLSSDAIHGLISSGHLIANSRQDWVLSPIAVAIKEGSALIDISSEKSLKEAVLSTPTLSYSTGPSGIYLEKLFDCWGISDVVKPKVVVPPPGIPVGKLVADDIVALGFQQLSELISISGINVLGILPQEIAYITTFSAGIHVSIKDNTERLNVAKDFLNFINSTEVEKVKLQQGMTGVE